MWKWFALASAFFAAMTAILSKIGVQGVPSNLATAIRAGTLPAGAPLDAAAELNRLREERFSDAR